MNQYTISQSGFLLLYTTLYLVTFRDATKLAAQWGAFEFRDGSVLCKKILPYSGPILLVSPILAYFVFSIFIMAVAPTTVSELGRLPLPILTVFLFILFPWVSLHVWSLVARQKIAEGVGRGQSGFGWLNTQEGPGVLPEIQYSLQVVAFFAATILILGVWFGPYLTNIKFPFADNFGSQLFVVIYVSQLVVLFHIAKRREYFTHNPKLLLSLRMLFTVLHTIVFPVMVGFFLVYPIALALDKRQFNWWDPVILFLALPFPLYCNQSTLLVAKYRHWRREEKGSIGEILTEVTEGGVTFWLLCFTFEVTMVAILLLIYGANR